MYTDGEKAVTISGKMKPLEAVLANDAAVELKLVHDTTGESVTIDKKNIAFLDETGETLTFTTEEQLYVGDYKIVFEINDTRLQDNLKCKSLHAAKNFRYRQTKNISLNPTAWRRSSAQPTGLRQVRMISIRSETKANI